MTSGNIMNDGLTGMAIVDICLDPSNPTTIFAATDSGVFRSLNDAEWWYPVNGNGGEIAIDKLMMNPYDPFELYAVKTYGSLMSITFGDGDLNHDRQVDAVDVALLADYLSRNIETLPGEVSEADLTVDGIVNAVDLVTLMSDYME